MRKERQKVKITLKKFISSGNERFIFTKENNLSLKLATFFSLKLDIYKIVYKNGLFLRTKYDIIIHIIIEIIIIKDDIEKNINL